MNLNQRKVFVVQSPNGCRTFELSQELSALQRVKDLIEQGKDVLFSKCLVETPADNKAYFKMLDEMKSKEILLNVENNIVTINKTILSIEQTNVSIRQNELALNIFKQQQLKVVATEDSDYPHVDVYLETTDSLELITSVEDSKEYGLRVHSYADLADDEPVTTHVVRN